MTQKKILVGIPAYNEEKTIGQLLEDIFNQRLDNQFDVLVVSDKSSDMTDNIILSYMKKYKNVKIIKKDKRTGKSSSLNIIFDYSKDYDIVILLDADIRLADNTLNFLLEKFFKYDIDLIAGNPIPFQDNNPNMAWNAAFFGWAIGTEIKNTHRYSLYHPYGCILALSRRLYNDMKVSVGMGDDTFIYLYCMQKKLIFEYEPKALVYIEISKTINDYLKQDVRRIVAIKENEKIFGRDLIDRHSRINNKYMILLTIFSRYPYKGMCWAIIYTYAQITALFKRENNPIWKIANTTKTKR